MAYILSTLNVVTLSNSSYITFITVPNPPFLPYHGRVLVGRTPRPSPPIRKVIFPLRPPLQYSDYSNCTPKNNTTFTVVRLVVWTFQNLRGSSTLSPFLDFLSFTREKINLPVIILPLPVCVGVRYLLLCRPGFSSVPYLSRGE